MRSFPVTLFLFAVACDSFVVMHQRARVLSSPLFSTAVNDNLRAALKKPSKTLGVVLEYYAPQNNNHVSVGDLTTLSMQLRKIKASAIFTSDITAAKVFVEEQATAQGNFPSPCPVIYSGNDIQSDVDTGISAIVVEAGVASENVDGVEKIYKVATPEDVALVPDGGAFMVDGDSETLDAVLQAISNGSVVIASIKAMQNDNAELKRGKELKELGVTSVLLEKACVGDGEDVGYSSFAIDGLTKKKSSTFNMTGLTGSTNGHFGGVASSTSTSWLRTKQ